MREWMRYDKMWAWEWNNAFLQLDWTKNYLNCFLPVLLCLGEGKKNQFFVLSVGLDVADKDRRTRWCDAMRWDVLLLSCTFYIKSSLVILPEIISTDFSAPFTHSEASRQWQTKTMKASASEWVGKMKRLRTRSCHGSTNKRNEMQ